MGRQQIRWFFLSCKRALMRPLFLLLLVLLPVGAFMIRQTEAADDGKIAVALFVDGDPWNEVVAKRLAEKSGSFRFYLCKTKEALVDDVASGRAECGYSFPAGFRKLLEQKAYKRAIRVTVSPSTVAADLASETVFAGLFEVYGEELLRAYVEEGRAFQMARETVEVSWEDVRPLYEGYCSNGSTFSFAYETVDGGILKENSMKTVFPVRGMGAVFVLVMGLTAAVMAAEDEKHGFYGTVTAGRKRGLQAVSVSALVVLACVSVAAALAAAGEFGASVGADGGIGSGMSGSAVGLCIGKELSALFGYGAAVVAFVMGLLMIVKNSAVLAGLIPFFIVGSLVVCPVFADLSSVVPTLRVVRWLFLPWYYLG